MNEAAAGINNILKNVAFLIIQCLDKLGIKNTNIESKFSLKVVYGKRKGCIFLYSPHNS